MGKKKVSPLRPKTPETLSPVTINCNPMLSERASSLFEEKPEAISVVEPVVEADEESAVSAPVNLTRQRTESNYADNYGLSYAMPESHNPFSSSSLFSSKTKDFINSLEPHSRELLCYCNQKTIENIIALQQKHGLKIADIDYMLALTRNRLHFGAHYKKDLGIFNNLLTSSQEFHANFQRALDDDFNQGVIDSISLEKLWASYHSVGHHIAMREGVKKLLTGFLPPTLVDLVSQAAGFHDFHQHKDENVPFCSEILSAEKFVANTKAILTTLKNSGEFAKSIPAPAGCFGWFRRKHRHKKRIEQAQRSIDKVIDLLPFLGHEIIVNGTYIAGEFGKNAPLCIIMHELSKILTPFFPALGSTTTQGKKLDALHAMVLTTSYSDIHSASNFYVLDDKTNVHKKGPKSAFAEALNELFGLGKKYTPEENKIKYSQESLLIGQNIRMAPEIDSMRPAGQKVFSNKEIENIFFKLIANASSLVVPEDPPSAKLSSPDLNEKTLMEDLDENIDELLDIFKNIFIKEQGFAGSQDPSIQHKVALELDGITQESPVDLKHISRVFYRSNEEGKLQLLIDEQTWQTHKSFLAHLVSQINKLKVLEAQEKRDGLSPRMHNLKKQLLIWFFWCARKEPGREYMKNDSYEFLAATIDAKHKEAEKEKKRLKKAMETAKSPEEKKETRRKLHLARRNSQRFGRAVANSLVEARTLSAVGQAFPVLRTATAVFDQFVTGPEKDSAGKLCRGWVSQPL